MRLLHALSFDVEEHFQVANFAKVISRDDWDRVPSRVEQNVNTIFTLCERANVKATFFTLGWVAERHKSLVREIVARGHELASHGYDHQFVDVLGEHGFRDDVRRTKNILEDISGAAVLGFRASTFTITKRTPWALQILAEENYKYDASIFPVKHPAYGVPDAPRNVRIESLNNGRSIVEFPPLTLRWMNRNIGAGGGGYFRLFPYVYTSTAFARAEKEGLSGSLYLHPWEFDPEQPRVKAGFVANLRHYRNLTETGARLERLLKDYSFSTMRDVIVKSLGPGVL
ncbi:MAG: XrtA system polysaccharide deacetylase [Planctomycetota bacterium]